MKSLLLAILLLAAMQGCRTARPTVPPTPMPTLERTITITKQVHDTLLVVKADTAKYAARLATDSASGSIILKPAANLATNRARANVRVNEHNWLLVDCICDTAAILFEWEQQHIRDSSRVTIYPPPQLIEKPWSAWQRVQLWAGRIFLLLLLVLLGGALVRLFLIPKSLIKRR